MSGLIKGGAKMEIKMIGVVGAGQMGSGIAEVGPQFWIQCPDERCDHGGGPERED